MVSGYWQAMRGKGGCVVHSWPQLGRVGHPGALVTVGGSWGSSVAVFQHKKPWKFRIKVQQRSKFGNSCLKYDKEEQRPG